MSKQVTILALRENNKNYFARSQFYTNNNYIEVLYEIEQIQAFVSNIYQYFFVKKKELNWKNGSSISNIFGSFFFKKSFLNHNFIIMNVYKKTSFFSKNKIKNNYLKGDKFRIFQNRLVYIGNSHNIGKKFFIKKINLEKKDFLKANFFLLNHIIDPNRRKKAFLLFFMRFFQIRKINFETFSKILNFLRYVELFISLNFFNVLFNDLNKFLITKQLSFLVTSKKINIIKSLKRTQIFNELYFYSLELRYLLNIYSKNFYHFIFKNRKKFFNINGKKNLKKNKIKFISKKYKKFFNFKDKEKLKKKKIYYIKKANNNIVNLSKYFTKRYLNFATDLLKNGKNFTIKKNKKFIKNPKKYIKFGKNKHLLIRAKKILNHNRPNVNSSLFFKQIKRKINSKKIIDNFLKKKFNRKIFFFGNNMFEFLNLPKKKPYKNFFINKKAKSFNYSILKFINQKKPRLYHLFFLSKPNFNLKYNFCPNFIKYGKEIEKYFYLSFFLKDLNILGNILVLLIKKNYKQINRVMRFLNESLSISKFIKLKSIKKPYESLKGLKIQYKGKLKKAGRKKKKVISHGNVSTQNLKLNTDYFFMPIKTKFGVSGLKISLFY